MKLLSSYLGNVLGAVIFLPSRSLCLIKWGSFAGACTRHGWLSAYHLLEPYWSFRLCREHYTPQMKNKLLSDWQ